MKNAPVGGQVFQRGAKKSQYRLAQLEYDPIGELVSQHKAIGVEIERQIKIRAGEIVELTALGKIKAYNWEVHMNLIEKQIKIGTELLRYGYGRVPETVNVEVGPPPAMIVNLTREGEQYVLNEPSEVEDE
jgi:hypothetical protein